MTTYATSGPISVTVDLAIGNVKFIASDRTDTAVTVVPAAPDNEVSREAARLVRVAHAPGELEIKQSITWRQKVSTKAEIGSVNVTVELPIGSRVRGKTAMGAVESEGSLGAFDFVSDAGGFRLGEVTDTLRIKTSTGHIMVGRAHSDVEAEAASGSIRIDEVVRGTVSLNTSLGEIEIGVRPGSAANLDVRSRLGRIRNELNALNGESSPGEAAETVKIRARTNLDDIIIRRS